MGKPEKSFDIQYKSASVHEEEAIHVKFGDDPLRTEIFEMDLFPSPDGPNTFRRPSLFMNIPEDILRKRVGCSDASLFALTKLRNFAVKHPNSAMRLVISNLDMPNPRSVKMVSDAMYFIGHEADKIGIDYFFWHKDLKVIMALPYPDRPISAEE